MAFFQGGTGSVKSGGGGGGNAGGGLGSVTDMWGDGVVSAARVCAVSSRWWYSVVFIRWLFCFVFTGEILCGCGCVCVVARCILDAGLTFRYVWAPSARVDHTGGKRRQHRTCSLLHLFIFVFLFFFSSEFASFFFYKRDYCCSLRFLTAGGWVSHDCTEQRRNHRKQRAFCWSFIFYFCLSISSPLSIPYIPVGPQFTARLA